MKIVFLGTGAIGGPSLRALAADPHIEVAAVFTQPDKPAGRQMKLRPSPIKEIALELGLPVFQPVKLRTPESVAEIAQFGADVFVVIAYGQILPKSVLDLPRFACLNVHASLLPLHRGASPIQSAILAGDAETGVTIMQMDVGLDTGPMMLKAATPIGERETAGELHDRLAGIAVEPLRQVLRSLEAGDAVREAQDDSLATYAPKLKKEDGLVDWTLPSVEIDLRIRAMLPWPGAFTRFNGDEILKIHRFALSNDAQGAPGVVISSGNEGILVAAGSGGILLEEVQVAGGKRLAAGDFLRGRPMPAGTVLS